MLRSVNECPLLAQSGHPSRAQRCPLLGVKRTLPLRGMLAELKFEFAAQPKFLGAGRWLGADIRQGQAQPVSGAWRSALERFAIGKNASPFVRLRPDELRSDAGFDYGHSRHYRAHLRS